MASLNVYLSFDGTCKNAMEFYQEALGGKLDIMTYENAPMPMPEEHKSRILHSHLMNDGLMIMAADSMPGQPVISGTNYSMSLACNSQEEQDKIWNKLIEGGNIIMPLADQFWGARYGMLTDQFGINWMLNWEKPNQ